MGVPHASLNLGVHGVIGSYLTDRNRVVLRDMADEGDVEVRRSLGLGMDEVYFLTDQGRGKVTEYQRQR